MSLILGLLNKDPQNRLCCMELEVGVAPFTANLVASSH
jgi:hypothetical protein